jgi:hypothetical protein
MSGNAGNFRPSDLVRLHGLRGRADLNGQTGHVVERMPTDAERWTVLLADGASVGVKECNLQHPKGRSKPRDSRAGTQWVEESDDDSDDDGEDDGGGMASMMRMMQNQYAFDDSARQRKLDKADAVVAKFAAKRTGTAVKAANDGLLVIDAYLRNIRPKIQRRFVVQFRRAQAFVLQQNCRSLTFLSFGL